MGIPRPPGRQRPVPSTMTRRGRPCAPPSTSTRATSPPEPTTCGSSPSGRTCTGGRSTPTFGWPSWKRRHDRFEAALAVLEHAVQLDPVAEEVFRRLMTLEGRDRTHSTRLPPPGGELQRNLGRPRYRPGAGDLTSLPTAHACLRASRLRRAGWTVTVAPTDEWANLRTYRAIVRCSPRRV